MTTTTTFPAIRAWGHMIMSHTAYIAGQVQRATDENAPHLAIYRRDNGEWATLDEVTSPTTRDWFKRRHPELAQEAGWANG